MGTVSKNQMQPYLLAWDYILSSSFIFFVAATDTSIACE